MKIRVSLIVLATWLVMSFRSAHAEDSTPPDPPRPITEGKFKPTWDSLKQYQFPDWFRDAKFGIWAHWTAQSQPEDSDWYARDMYIQGHSQYIDHLQHYGHPTKFGFKDIDNIWHAENWDPEKLMALYKKAGAKYFVALANHHDNFDCWDSKYQPWNSVNIGPHKDIVGTWAKIARDNGLKFGVSNHSSRSWRWFQTAYGHDIEGPLAGVPYDGWLTKADGKGTWWEGYDPQDLYCGPRIMIPKDITTIADLKAWELKNTTAGGIPPNDKAYCDKWFNRTKDLVDQFHPDLLYFDDTELPLGQRGLDIAADYYNSDMAAHNGELQGVLTSKGLKPEHLGALTLDIERGRSDKLEENPWQTDTCIGQWHYARNIKYKTSDTVIKMLVDIVSKNGNLLLNIPVKGDGTIDADEVKFLGEMADWMAVNHDAIFGTRPWKVYGEGPPDVVGHANFNEKPGHVYTSEDIRFTTKGDTLYAFMLDWPKDGKVNIKSLGGGGKLGDMLKPTSVTLLGSQGELKWTQGEDGLHVQLPDQKPCDHAYAIKLAGMIGK